jgi:DNA-directed RNA polymerase specialized sigma24 family protein
MKCACKKSLDAGFQELLMRDSSIGLSLWVSVSQSLNQFHLRGAQTEAGIINEVYVRAAKFIDQGGEIDHLISWCRATAYNYIRELSRRSRREESYDRIQSIVENCQNRQGLITEDAIAEELVIIRRAFDQLTPADRELINLSVVNNLSWRDIRQYFSQQGHPDRNEAALRKAKERAIRRLRENYHGMKSPQPSS